MSTDGSTGEFPGVPHRDWARYLDEKTVSKSAKLYSRRLISFVSLAGLPKLNAVAVGIHDPGKLSLIVLFDYGIHPHAFFSQGIEHGVQIVCHIIHHER